MMRVQRRHTSPIRIGKKPKPNRYAMCNLYSITKNQDAIRQLVQVTEDSDGNLPSMQSVSPDHEAKAIPVALPSVSCKKATLIASGEHRFLNSYSARSIC